MNTLGIVKLFMPKKDNLNRISFQEIAYVEHLLNTRPRKCRNYRAL